MLRRLWLACVGLLAVAVLLPVGTRLSRLVTLALFAAVWIGLIVVAWPRPAVRWTALAVTAAGAGFLLAPARSRHDVATLRDDYVTALRGYDGVRYVWGGENARGIDCSGLVRRALAAPAPENPWFHVPITIVRWAALDGDAAPSGARP